MNDTWLRMELTNIGAWFGSRRKFTTFVPTGEGGEEITTFNATNMNYSKLIEELYDTFMNIGRVARVMYDHNGNGCYKITMKHKSRGVETLNLSPVTD